VIGVGARAVAFGVVRAEMLADVRKYRRAVSTKLREAGKVVLKEQRKLLRSGTAGPRAKRRAVTDEGGRQLYTKTGRRRTRQSQLLGAHRVRIQKMKYKSGEPTLARDFASSRVGQYLELEALVGPAPGGPGYYGKFHELGVGERRTKRGASRGRLPKRPWMGPAYELKRAEVFRILEQAADPLVR
jgi:hypothetical protein